MGWSFGLLLRLVSAGIALSVGAEVGVVTVGFLARVGVGVVAGGAGPHPAQDSFSLNGCPHADHLGVFNLAIDHLMLSFPHRGQKLPIRKLIGCLQSFTDLAGGGAFLGAGPRPTAAPFLTSTVDSFFAAFSTFILAAARSFLSCLTSASNISADLRAWSSWALSCTFSLSSWAIRSA